MPKEKMMKTERRLVTDAEAAEMRRPGSTRQTWPEDDAILALLDTREGLLAALGAISVIYPADSDEPSIMNARAILAQVKGES
jgi:hypothetical protein